MRRACKRARGRPGALWMGRLTVDRLPDHTHARQHSRSLEQYHKRTTLLQVLLLLYHSFHCPAPAAPKPSVRRRPPSLSSLIATGPSSSPPLEASSSDSSQPAAPARAEQRTTRQEGTDGTRCSRCKTLALSHSSQARTFTREGGGGGGRSHAWDGMQFFVAVLRAGVTCGRRAPAHAI